MRLRTPFVVTVVGALLVGGAPTGTTHALWHDDASVAPGTLTSGTMGIAASVAGPAQLQAGGPAQTVVGTVTDSSSAGAVNLSQDVRVDGVALEGGTGGLTLAHLDLAVTPKSGSCPTDPSTSGAVGYSTGVLGRTSPGDSFDICVAVAATGGAPTGSGTLRLDLLGQQVQADGSHAGWSSTDSVALDVSVEATPTTSTFTASCGGYEDPPGGGVSNSYFSIIWQDVPGASTFVVRRGATQLGSQSAAAARTYQVLRGDAGDIVVDALDAAGTLIAHSNPVRVSTSGNVLSCSEDLP